jgi:DNA-binding CsgD family transcriptional regulator
VFRSDRLAFEMMCPLAAAGSRSRRLIFFRAGTHDFSERDRFVMSLLRPHLVEAVARSGAAATSLTERQTQLLRLVADGLTNAQIAVSLNLSPHTVRTHLANIFERLGVTSRAGAVARAFPG